jgi:hypothetical protein
MSTTMKTHLRISLVAAAAGLALVSGCSKQEAPPAVVTETPKVEAASAPVKEAADAVQQPAVPAQAAVEKAAADVQTQTAAATTTVTRAAADMQAQAQAPVNSLTSRTQASLDQVQKLIADKKPADALKLLGDLATAKLTPEQQAMFDRLKKQAQDLLQQSTTSQATDKAADALGGLLKKK